jgi:hypothetical protein
MPAAVRWESDERCVVREKVFQVIPSDFWALSTRIPTEGADFLLFKTPPLVNLYVELVREIRPRHIFELGIKEGGSTAFLFELARPRRMVAIDQKPPVEPRLSTFITKSGIDEVLRVHYDVDQADRRRVAEIFDDAFGNDALDLVSDDCSHTYTATRASFNELFPRLRGGGLYVIEDWRWVCPNHVALSRLILELVLASASAPGLIDRVVFDSDSVRVTRGEAPLDPHDFDICDCLDQVGRSLLAREELAVADSESPTAPSRADE